MANRTDYVILGNSHILLDSEPTENGIYPVKGSGVFKFVNDKIDALPKAMTYKGAVDYYSLLPVNASVGDVYTVKYKGSSGTEPLGAEYVYTKNVTTQLFEWIEIGKDSVLPAGTNNGEALIYKNNKWDKESGYGYTSSTFTPSTEWNCFIGSKPSFTFGGNDYYVKVSDTAFTSTELLGKSFTYVNGGMSNELEINQSMLQVDEGTGVIAVSVTFSSLTTLIIVAPQDVTIEGVTISQGTWFLKSGDNPPFINVSLTGITIQNESIDVVKIDKKFIPVTVSSSGVTDGTNTFNASNKQDTLVSGVNIKKINGSTILGDGNINCALYLHTIKLNYDSIKITVISIRNTAYTSWDQLVLDHDNGYLLNTFIYTHDKTVNVTSLSDGILYYEPYIQTFTTSQVTELSSDQVQSYFDINV